MPNAKMARVEGSGTEVDRKETPEMSLTNDWVILLLVPTSCQSQPNDNTLPAPYIPDIPAILPPLKVATISTSEPMFVNSSKNCVEPPLE